MVVTKQPPNKAGRDADAGLLHPLLEEILETGRVGIPDGGFTALHSNISREEAVRLARVVRKLAPRVSVEIGFAHGVSTLAILHALAPTGQGAHHVVDPYQGKWDYIGRGNVERAGLAPRMTFHEKFAEEVIPQLPAIQFAFIDSSHLFDHSIAEFVMIDRKLDPGGVVGFHDLWMPSLQKVLRYILTNRNYRIHVEEGQPAHTARASRRFLSRLLRGLPMSAYLFRPELLQPNGTLGLGELMVFIEKLGPDTRKWRHHAAF
jgi:predicted O-methyltransferase YrrM